MESFLTDLLNAQQDIKIHPKIPLKESRSQPRQFDGVIIHSIPDLLTDVKIAIEVKYWNQDVQVNKVDSFYTALSDCGFNKGVMITNKGFQAGAIDSARRHDIDLLLFKKMKNDYLSNDSIKTIGIDLNLCIPEINNFQLSLYQEDFSEQEKIQIHKKTKLTTHRKKNPILFYSQDGQIASDIFSIIDRSVKNYTNLDIDNTDKKEQSVTANLEEYNLFTFLPETLIKRAIRVRSVSFNVKFQYIHHKMDIIGKDYYFLLINCISLEERIIPDETVYKLLEKYQLDDSFL
ncbi:MAG: hypothetical protein HeimC3_53560 [Candidatus Heimdallarchaeota archaeon LC_3]|nr:MAG: hypothetical protein HeimC3_53560 [Candidatus Heimdallarchaeota archaeon LC_3]